MAPPKPIQGIWNLPSIPEPLKRRSPHFSRDKKPTDFASANEAAAQGRTAKSAKKHRAMRLRLRVALYSRR